MAVDGNVADLAPDLHVQRVVIRCPKRVVRSKHLQPEAGPDSSDTPTIQQAMIRHGPLARPAEELTEEAEREGLLRLY